MPDTSLSNSKIIAAYRERTPNSAAKSRQARGLLPSGLVHDSRKLDPYPFYVERAAGPRKWDIDGNEYVDYFGGHGALILGHCHPALVEAVQAQIARGSHFGACHESEVRWAELVQQLVPCAEKVRFTSSGTEANLMALRLARAFTGRDKVVRFKGHFHGWHDHAAFGVSNHFDGTPTPGVLAGIASGVLLAPPNDIAATRTIFESHDDIAAVILEPTGATFGQAPMTAAFIHELRAITAERDVVLIFDEVVTGFRVAPGGAQQVYGLLPDLCTMAKILAGGLPGGAVAGRADILELLDFEIADAKGFEKIGHQGTYNANPLSAAAGVAMLERIAAGGVCEAANASGAAVREALNTVFEDEGVPWACYGEHSGFYVFTNPNNLAIAPRAFDPLQQDAALLKAGAPEALTTKLRLGLILNGVDMSSKPGGITSAVHGADEVARTAEAFRRTIRMLKDEGDLAA